MHQWKVRHATPATVQIRSTRPNTFSADVLHIRAGETPERIQTTESKGVIRAELDANRVNTILGPNSILAISTSHFLGLSTVDLTWGWRYRIFQDGAPAPVPVNADGEPLDTDSDGFVLADQQRFAASSMSTDSQSINFIPHAGLP